MGPCASFLLFFTGTKLRDIFCEEGAVALYTIKDRPSANVTFAPLRAKTHN